MELQLILDGKAKVDDLVRLNGLGYEFIVNNGKVTQICKHGQVILSAD